MKYEMYKQHHICKPKYIWYILLNIKLLADLHRECFTLYLIYFFAMKNSLLPHVILCQWIAKRLTMSVCRERKNVDQLLLTVSLRDHRLLRKWNTLDLYWQLYFYISFEFNAILLKVGLSVFNALYPQGHDFENYIHMELLYKGFWR